MKIRLLRHATHSIEANGSSFLVDPMLSPKGSWDPIPNTPEPRRNPLVGLPVGPDALSALLGELDGVVVTHGHFDHWDGEAKKRIPKGTPIFCQPQDEGAIRQAGFEQVTAVDPEAALGRVQILRTGGLHGSGKMADRMGPVSGFVLRAEGGPCLYVAGDTVWCEEVERVLEEHRPDVVVLYAGAAQFLEGGPITMTAEDVIRVCEVVPTALVVAIHMEAINHCVLTRRALREALEARGLQGRVKIPEDGEELSIRP